MDLLKRRVFSGKVKNLHCVGERLEMSNVLMGFRPVGVVGILASGWGSVGSQGSWKWRSVN